MKSFCMLMCLRGESYEPIIALSCAFRGKYRWLELVIRMGNIDRIMEIVERWIEGNDEGTDEIKG